MNRRSFLLGLSAVVAATRCAPKLLATKLSMDAHSYSFIVQRGAGELWAALYDLDPRIRVRVDLNDPESEVGPFMSAIYRRRISEL